MTRIPRHFHFVFGLKPQTEPFHIVHYLCLESCLQVNRPERVTLYYHHEPHGRWWDRIRDRLHLVRVPAGGRTPGGRYRNELIRSFSYAHEADFIRLEKLLKHGGVYADMDTLFINPVPDALFEKSCVLGRERPVPQENGRPDEESLCNALIMAEPGAPFVRRWLEGMPEAFDGSWSQHSCQLPHRLSRLHPEEIHVEGERSFYPYMWTKEDLHALLEERHENWDGVCSVHLWNHLWWARLRLDFSSFSGERLTERFIRGGGNTYALAARRFLPPVAEQPRLQRWKNWVADLACEHWARRHEWKRALLESRRPRAS